MKNKKRKPKWELLGRWEARGFTVNLKDAKGLPPEKCIFGAWNGKDAPKKRFEFKWREL